MPVKYRKGKKLSDFTSHDLETVAVTAYLADEGWLEERRMPPKTLQKSVMENNLRLYMFMDRWILTLSYSGNVSLWDVYHRRLTELAPVAFVRLPSSALYFAASMSSSDSDITIASNANNE